MLGKLCNNTSQRRGSKEAPQIPAEGDGGTGRGRNAWKNDAGVSDCCRCCLAGGARSEAAAAGPAGAAAAPPPPLPGPGSGEAAAQGEAKRCWARCGETIVAFGCLGDSADDESRRVNGKAGGEEPRCFRSQDVSDCQRSLLRERSVCVRGSSSSRGGCILATI